MRFESKNSLIFILFFGLFSVAFSEVIGLEQVIKEVSTKSDSVKMMRETVNRSKYTIKEKRAAALPTVSTQIFTGRSFGVGLGASGGGGAGGMLSETDPTPASRGDLNQIINNQIAAQRKMSEANSAPAYSASIEISQPIYTFGKIGTAVKVANYYGQSNQLAYERGVQEMQLLGLDAFYRVVLSDMALSITERTMERKKELSEFLTRNFQLGAGSKAEILATSADLESLYPEIIKAQQDVKTAKMQLCVLMGRPLTDLISIDTTSTIPSLIAFELPNRDSAVKTALENRSDLHSIEYLKKANDGGVKIFKSMYLPSIAGQLSMGAASNDIAKIYKENARNWKVGIGLTWTMFDGFANSSTAQQYLSDSRKLNTAQKSLAKFIEIEVEAALTECIAADSNLSASYKIFAAVQEAYELTDENFKQGSGQFAELQLAEERLRQGEMGIMNARYRQMRSRAALLVTMGCPIINTEEK